MTKIEQLRAMVLEWEKEKSLTLAYDICEFLSKNLERKDEQGPGSTDR